MIELGTVKPGSTLRIPFSTFDKDDGSSITMTSFAVGDILVYKDGSTTERASTAGYAATTDFDAKTGKQLAVIDLADNTTAGFFAAGSEYIVAIDAVTVDAVTTGGWIARFRIGYVGAILDTTIATLASQTSFTLSAGPAEDDALNGFWVMIHDVASAVQAGWAVVSDYTGSTKTVTLAAGTTFTAAATDNISVMAPSPLQPTVAARTLDVSAGGEAGLDWANVGGQSTSVNLSGTTTNLVNTVTTYTGNTVQTGDSFARIGATGSGLTTLSTAAELAKVPKSDSNVTWNATALASIQSEAEDAIVAHRLDELLNADSDIDGAAPPTVGSVFHELMSKTAGSFTFDQTTDSNEALRDRGDAAWATAVGFSTHSAADVWSSATRTLTGTQTFNLTGNVTGNLSGSVGSVTAAITLPTIPTDWITADGIAANAIGASELATDAVQEIRNAITGGAYALDTDANGAIRIVDGTGAREIDTSSGNVTLVDASLTTAKLGSFQLAKTTHITGFNDLSTAQVNAEADTALADVGLTTTITGRIDAATSTRATPAQVNTEVLDVLNVDTFAEPGQGAPGATVSLVAKISSLYKAWRNRTTQTSSQYSLYNDDASTIDHKATVSDNGTTFDRGEVATGP